jgi:hypothetical protein
MSVIRFFARTGETYQFTPISYVYIGGLRYENNQMDRIK